MSASPRSEAWVGSVPTHSSSLALPVLISPRPNAMDQHQTLGCINRRNNSISLKLCGGSVHQIRDSRPSATDVEIISHQRRDTDESSDVIRNENCVRQPEDSCILLSGKAGSENLSVRVGTGVQPTQTLFDLRKTATSAAAAYLVARGLLSQFQDPGKNVGIVGSANSVNGLPCVNTTSSHDPLLPRSSSSSSEDLTGQHNSSSTTEVELRPTHFSGNKTSSFLVSRTTNQHSSPRVDNFVSGPASIPRPPTNQDSVFPHGDNRNCESTAKQLFGEVDSELPSSPEATPEDLPALLCRFLFGSPDSVNSCDTAVTIVEEDLQSEFKNGSMDFMLSPPASDITQFQPHDNEERNREILGDSPSKSDAESVISVNGEEIMSEDAEKQNDEESSEVCEERNIEQCVKEVSPSTVSTSTEKDCGSKAKCRISKGTSNHIREVQRGISEESGYHTSSENHVKSGMETSSTGEVATGDEDVEDNANDPDEDTVFVPSGE